MTTRLIGVNDVAEQLDVSKAYAYKVIRNLSAELEAAGCLIVKGKVNAEYFEHKYFGEPSARHSVKEGE
ncbi:MAG: LysR family transcriptional regulator [Acidobacteriota bacterium]|nr:LysR family transcriptional regulator [Acidobacteriota bacterium]